MAEEAQSESNRSGGTEEGGESLVAEARGVYVMYQGCWLRPRAMQSVKLVQEHFKARPDDTLLVTFPKCGTTWLKALAFTVTNRFDHAATTPVTPTRCSPNTLRTWCHSSRCPTASSTLSPTSRSLPPPRLLATHMPITLLPPCMSNNTCRVVYLFRDPKDVFVSLWQFISKVRTEYTIDRAFDSFSEGLSPYGPIWEHNLGFWKKSIAENDKVLFLKYEEMMAEPVKHFKMLARFLRAPFTEQDVSRGVVEDVVHLCSFDKLKSIPINSSGGADRIGGVPMENSSYFRTGKVGDWANHLTEEMAKKLDAIVEEKLRGSGLIF